MAYIDLTVTTAAAFNGGIPDIAGVAATLTDGNQFLNDGKTRLSVVNGSGGALTVTFALPATPKNLNGLVATQPKTVATGKTAIYGPFEPGTYNQTDGKVRVVFSSVTSVTVLAFNETPTPA